MKIEYLIDVANYTYETHTGEIKGNEPLSFTEIQDLENDYNDGAEFPKVLRELLFLAGQSFHLLDHGLCENHQELQQCVRRELEEEGLKIDRPFFAIDIYIGGEQFFFVYLDEGDNPPVYEAVIENQRVTIRDVNNSLAAFLTHLIQLEKEDLERRNSL